MASVRKRTWTHKGVESEAWVVSYTDQGGKRRLKTFDKKKEADRHRTLVETEMEQGIHTADSETLTVAQAGKLFLDDCERRRQMGDMTGGGVKGYAYKVGVRIVQGLGHHRLNRLTGPLLQDYFDELRRPYSAHTVIGVHASLSALLTFAVRRKWVRRNVLRDEPVRLPRAKQRADVPTKADITALLKATAERGRWEGYRPYLNRRAMVCLGVFAGLRPGETIGLQWSDVDWEKSLIKVRHSQSRTDGLKDPKSLAGVRDVPMTAPVQEALEQLLLYEAIVVLAKADRAGSSTDDAVRTRIRVLWDRRDTIDARSIAVASGYVLRSRYGRNVAPDRTGEFFNRAMRDAGLYDEAKKRPRFTLHALRHAAASLFIEWGLPAINLKTVMGHASVSTTYDVYGHLFPEDTRTAEAANAIAGAFMATRPRQETVSA